MKGYSLMYGYAGKVIGMIMASTAFIALMIQKFTHFTIVEKMNSAQHFNLLLLVTVLGLSLIAFSKEKHEDERVHRIRTHSFMIAYGLTFAMSLTFATVATMLPIKPEFANGISLSAAELVDAGRTILFFMLAPLVIHLVMFHIGLHFDQLWNYENESWSPGALLKNWKVVIGTILALYFIITLLQKILD